MLSLCACVVGEGRVVVICWWLCQCINEGCVEVTGCGEGCIGYVYGVCVGVCVFVVGVSFGQVA